MQPYPLAWPVVYPRTHAHQRNNTRSPVGFAQARWTLFGELLRFHAEDIVLSTNLQLDDNNEPTSSYEPEDPGVAVWFKVRVPTPKTRMCSVQCAIACDRWSSVRLNLGALSATMMGLRGMYRFGTAHVLDALLSGLHVPPDAIISDPAPPPDAPKVPQHDGTNACWWHVLGFNHPAEASREEAEKRYRTQVKQAHPDRGGSDDAMRIFNAAIEQAREHFTPPGE